MKRIRSLWTLTLAALLLAACGTEAPPTPSMEEVRGTAVAAALTIVAQTQAAIPTNTPVPPTETPTSTPQPTNTPLTLPTLAETSTNTPASAGGDYCQTRVLGAPKGNDTVIKIENATKLPIHVSLFLNKTALDECGWREYEIGKKGSVVITDLVYGCYNLWAWSNDPKNPFQSSGYGCINNPDKWTFQVHESTIQFE
ncbi:MAG: hypothetical protein IT313_05310 [Anaerolineales bacterium]|nr:hypothetical protein [Anaerolineales bacterium]